MQKDQLFFKDFSSGLFLAGLVFTVFFAVAIFFELAVAKILSIAPSQSRIALSMAFVMGSGILYFLVSKKTNKKKIGGISLAALLSAVFLGLKFYSL